jgi:hypothetical protein
MGLLFLNTSLRHFPFKSYGKSKQWLYCLNSSKRLILSFGIKLQRNKKEGRNEKRDERQLR